MQKNILTKLEKKARDIMKFYQLSLFEKASFETSISTIFENVSSLYSHKDIEIEKVIDTGLIIDKDCMRVIFIISKELINNVYKHSDATYLNYKIYKKEEFILIEINSDGASLEDFANIKESKKSKKLKLT